MMKIFDRHLIINHRIDNPLLDTYDMHISYASSHSLPNISSDFYSLIGSMGLSKFGIPML